MVWNRGILAFLVHNHVLIRILYYLLIIKVIIITEKCAETCLKCQINEKMCPEHSTWNPKDLHQFETQDIIKCTEKYCYCSNGNSQVNKNVLWNYTYIHTKQLEQILQSSVVITKRKIAIFKII